MRTGRPAVGPGAPVSRPSRRRRRRGGARRAAAATPPASRRSPTRRSAVAVGRARVVGRVLAPVVQPPLGVAPLVVEDAPQRGQRRSSAKSDSSGATV